MFSQLLRFEFVFVISHFTESFTAYDFFLRISRGCSCSQSYLLDRMAGSLLLWCHRQQDCTQSRAVRELALAFLPLLFLLFFFAPFSTFSFFLSPQPPDFSRDISRVLPLTMALAFTRICSYRF